MRRLPILVVAALVLTACNGDDDASTTTTAVDGSTVASSSTSSTPAPTTTDATTSTTTEPTTPDTTAPTSAPPTTTTSPTIPDDLEEVRAAVAEAVVASWEALDNFARNPTDPDAAADLRELMTDEEFTDFVDDVIVRYVVNDLAERPNPDFPASITPYPDTLVFDQDAGTATMEFCFVSTNLLVLIEDDGTERLQDDRVGVVLGDDSFMSSEGRWIDSGGSTAEVIEGATTCPDR